MLIGDAAGAGNPFHDHDGNIDVLLDRFRYKFASMCTVNGDIDRASSAVAASSVDASKVSCDYIEYYGKKLDSLRSQDVDPLIQSLNRELRGARLTVFDRSDCHWSGNFFMKCFERTNTRVFLPLRMANRYCEGRNTFLAFNDHLSSLIHTNRALGTENFVLRREVAYYRDKYERKEALIKILRLENERQATEISSLQVENSKQALEISNLRNRFVENSCSKSSSPPPLILTPMLPPPLSPSRFSSS